MRHLGNPALDDGGRIPAGADVWLLPSGERPSQNQLRKAGVTDEQIYTVNRIWRQNGLQPHRVGTFNLSNDPQFVERLTDVVGLYMNPPENALVLCVDERSQIQALDPTHPGLPLKKGRASTMTHDYNRNGTAALVPEVPAAAR